MISYLLSWIILDNLPSAEAYVVFESYIINFINRLF